MPQFLLDHRETRHLSAFDRIATNVVSSVVCNVVVVVSRPFRGGEGRLYA